ncbi:hypothetical protein M427DRAFT_44823 [Gonapodya prolifera JEL478]|uniref:Uncharacterized protein n=1 Tax=Gonapodya prolifera (strain JEL478) TaxID=1344416 RepID=A0A139ADM4_GONPJ|nr:hypothetical protein M427DRAFT_44823 [Gonapodya prolifera JEL478]|eukprot:KXS14858.1 hypothetical protein M427DRAFT_44823 [Gonapodya prolifera JEL478]
MGDDKNMDDEKRDTTTAKADTAGEKRAWQSDTVLKMQHSACKSDVAQNRISIENYTVWRPVVEGDSGHMSATGNDGNADKTIDSPTTTLTRKRHSVNINSSDDGDTVDGNRNLRCGMSDSCPQAWSLLLIPKPPQSNKRGPQKPPVPSHLAKFVPPRSSPLRKAVQLDPSRLPVRHVD